MPENQTLQYYNQNAEMFSAATLKVDFSDVQQAFLEVLPEKAHILDFGCGSGRDSKYFLEREYQVTSVDGSEKMCRLASTLIGQPVRQMLFHELNDSSLNSSKSNKLPKWDPFFKVFAGNQYLMYEVIHDKPELHKQFEACYRDNLHSIWAGQELYRKGNSKEAFYKILEKNMMPVYDSARRQGYEIWGYC